jgi:hypothetical protein
LEQIEIRGKIEMLLRNITNAVCIGCKPWASMEEILRVDHLGSPSLEFTTEDSKPELTMDDEALTAYIEILPKSSVPVLHTGNCRHTATIALAKAGVRYILLQHNPDGSLESVSLISKGTERTKIWENGSFVALTSRAGS